MSKKIIFKLKELITSDIYDLKQLLMGRVLTIIDASIADVAQRKAIKDLTRQAIWDEEAWTRSILEKIYQFDEISNLNFLKENEDYREFMGLPTELVKKENAGKDFPANPNFFTNLE